MRALFLINPPERRGYSNEHSLSGEFGVSLTIANKKMQNIPLHLRSK